MCKKIRGKLKALAIALSSVNIVIPNNTIIINQNNCTCY